MKVIVNYHLIIAVNKFLNKIVMFNNTNLNNRMILLKNNPQLMSTINIFYFLLIFIFK